MSPVLSGVKNGRNALSPSVKGSMTEEEKIEETEKEIESSQEQQVEEKAPEKTVDVNWERARQLMESQQAKINELESRLHEVRENQTPVEKDELEELDPSDYVTVEKAQKLAEKKAKQVASQMVREYAQQQTLQNSEDKARTKYDDYDFVIENYALPLLKNDKALAYQVQNSKNPAETAYKLGKLSDAYEEPAMKQQTSSKAEKILKNSSRPVSGNAVGSPLKTQADQFSKMSKEDVWAASQKYARGGT